MARRPTLRPPLLLWRRLLLDQWVLVGLTTVIVSTVIAFAATIKPLADGLLDPIDAVSFMLLAIPPMLAYALPFAAGFGTTLAYHRQVNANEILAAHAGGISHRAILTPALLSGLTCAILLGLLNEQVLPRMLRSMERMVTRDVASWVVRSVETGRPLEFDGYNVHANSAILIGPDDRTGAFQRIRLRGVLVTQFDDVDFESENGEVTTRREVVAEASTTQAHVWLVRAESETGGPDEGVQAYIVLGETVARSSGDISFTKFDSLEMPPQFVPGAFDNDPKFLTFSELRELREYPERMDFVTTRQRTLAFHLAELDIAGRLESQFAAFGEARIFTPQGQTLSIRGAGIRRAEGSDLRIVPEQRGESIEVTRIDGERITRWIAPRASFKTAISGDSRSRILALSLELENPALDGGPGQGLMARRESLKFGDLRLGRDEPIQDLANAYMAQAPSDVIAEANRRMDAGDPRSEWLADSTETLEKRIEKLQREITSKQHERLAMSASCLVNTLTGAIAAMRLRNALTLVVYLWSFLPALGVLLTISGGQQLVHSSGRIGLSLLWGGVAALAVASGVAYTGLRRH